MMTTTRAIANDIGAAPIRDNSCATPSSHSGMVVFPQSDRIRTYLRPESYFSTQPLTGNYAVYSLTRRSQRCWSLSCPRKCRFVQKTAIAGLSGERDARNGCGGSKPRLLRPRLLHFDREERSLPCSPPSC